MYFGPVRKSVDLDLSVPCCETLVDTTMALYRSDTYRYWMDGSLRFDRDHGIIEDGWINPDNATFNPKYARTSLRVGGHFTAEHLGWFTEKKYLPDFFFYRNKTEATKYHPLSSRT